MPSFCVRCSLVRIITPHNRALRPAAIIAAICCCLSAASGQWLETTIALSDSFGSIWPTGVYFVPSGNCVYVAGEGGVIVADPATNVRAARIDQSRPKSMACGS